MESTITFRPSQVTKPLFDTVWRNSERETIATNLLKMARSNGDAWSSFTWDDYVGFCSHSVSPAEKAIINEFAETGYLKDENGIYSFTAKMIGVYMQYSN